MKIRGVLSSVIGHSLAFPDGTSSAPSATFSSDLAQGFWLDTTNDLVGATGLSVLGRLLQTALATPGSITVTNVGTAGATTYTYVLVALSGTGVTPAGAASSTATGNATLDGTNYNTLAWTQVAGATGYRVYRTVGGATQGLIATIAAGTTVTVNDTGLAGGGETAPTVNTTGTLLLGSADETLASLALATDADTGLSWPTANALGVHAGGTEYFRVQPAVVILSSAATFGWSSGALGNPYDLILARDAANTLALKNSTSGQVFNHYGSEITAGTRYSRLAIKHATTSVTAAVGATVTATGLIPAKANVLGINTVVTTALGTGTGTTGYTVGDGSDADRWGSVTGTVAGTDTDQTDATANPTGWFTAANDVVLTALTGNFDGTGVILIDVAYTMTEAA